MPGRTQCIGHVQALLYIADLVLDGEVDEVGVHQDLIWWSQLAVVLEKQSC